MKVLRIGEREKEILKMIGLGALILASIAMPNLPAALRPFIKKRGKKEFRKTLQRLDEKGIIYLSGEKIKLTKRGEKILQEIEIKDLSIEKPAKWDKIWHLVSYDIPEHLKKERDWFRWNLEKLGFLQIHKSLWVLPYDCKEEIAIISQHLKISPFVVYMNTDSLPREHVWIKKFDLT